MKSAVSKSIHASRWMGRLMGLIRSIALSKGRIESYDFERLSHAEAYALALKVASERERRVLTELKAYVDNNIDDIEGVKHSHSEQCNGIEEAEYLIRRHDVESLLVDDDFYKLYIDIPRQKREHVGEKVNIAIFVLIVIAIITYFLPFFAEKRLFRSIEEMGDKFLIESYYSKYPDGKHIEEVMLYHMDRFADDRLSVMIDYMSQYPNGRYIDRVTNDYNATWSSIIASCDNLRLSGHDELADFLVEMLRYMQLSRSLTIGVEEQIDIDFKEFWEYDTEAQQSANFEQMRAGHNISDTVISIRKYLGDEQCSDIIGDTLYNNAVEFVSGLWTSDSAINICPLDKSEEENIPTICFRAKLRNGEREDSSGVVIPEVLALGDCFYDEGYTEEDLQYCVFNGYVMSVAVDLEVCFALPDGSASYIMTGRSCWSRDISPGRDASEAYSRIITDLIDQAFYDLSFARL